jgi:hypothetical protein
VLDVLSAFGLPQRRAKSLGEALPVVRIEKPAQRHGAAFAGDGHARDAGEFVALDVKLRPERVETMFGPLA